MNFLRAIIAGVHQDFGLASIREEYSLGSSSNIVRIKDALVEKEFIDITPNGIFIADPILETWLRERGKLWNDYLWTAEAVRSLNCVFDSILGAHVRKSPNKFGFSLT